MLTLVYCTSKKESSNSQLTNLDTLKLVAGNSQKLSDRQLSQAVCGSCHLFPEPDLLDKNTWIKGALPHMALRLGFISLKVKDNPYAMLSSDELQSVIQANIFPHKPLIDSATWNRIVKYYETEAPEKAIPQDVKPSVQKDLPLFKIFQKDISNTKSSLVTLIEFDVISNQWYVGDSQSDLYRLNQQFQVDDSLKLDSPPADIEFDSNGQLLIVTMGDMDPNDKAAGKLLSIDTLHPRLPKQANTVLQGLPRPVHISLADLNTDSLEDKIVCGFGNYTGKLAWYERLDNKQYQEHILKQTPGARKTIVHDVNKDGLPDLVALMTQGDEGVFAFFNQGKGKFKEMPLLRFPPVYGSSDFELTDFNQDGFIDILYTNGDNADFSYSLKKYHGVRLFLNNGKNKFEQVWFYPMHGATKALARDFDKDGDVDITAIAFFPDYTNAPEEGFIYFENTGGLIFQPQTFSNASKGRWLTMDVGDFDQDNDIDIALGSFIFSTTPVPDLFRQQWIKNGQDVIILENQKNTSAASIK